jgi:glycosyltransferase involved in cell wall biosynthesis
LTDANPLRLVLLARALGVGGAERQLVGLAAQLAKRGHHVTVVTLYPENMYRDVLERGGVNLHTIEKRGRWHIASFMLRLARSLAELRPDVIYSFLPVPNVLAGLFRLAARRHGLVWSLRASELQAAQYDRLSRLALRLEAVLAHVPDLIIANSEAGRRSAIARGFPRERVAVVPNGIDTERFPPIDKDSRSAAKIALGLPYDALTIGLVGRADPMKDHEGFLRAVALAAAERNIRVVIAGTEPSPRTARLQAFAQSLGLTERIVWLGSVTDIRPIYAALDVLCVASAFGEGFPNVLGEAMASGVPCVTTDVGDAATILGDLGPVVPPNSPPALAAAILEALDRAHLDASLPTRLRARIVENYGTDRMAADTEQLLLGVRARHSP